ncbi:unnamed protein product [Calypogeia fissa]
MGSIEGGRPPDGDSCSDEDENPELTCEEQDQHVALFLPSEWVPVARSFRPYQQPTSALQMVASRPLVAKLTKDIAETYKACNPNITFSVLPKRYLTEPWKGVYNDGQDNQDTDLILYVDFVLVNSESNIRYVVKEMLGKGSFGQVCKCSTSDPSYQGDVAVKVIKNQSAYYNQAKVEIGICYRLQMYTDRYNIVRILDHFEFAGHLCLVFELLNLNLYELLKLNHHKGLSVKLVRRFTTQILEALTALREAGVLHCDLKPENILLQPSLEAAEIKLIDFGSACMDFRIVYTYIQSRFYRSPEVLLQLKYTTAIDMWSLGCVAGELFLGLPLFPGACEYDLLRFMIEILGCQPPDHIIHQSEISNKFFKLTSSAPLSGQMATEGQSPAYQLLSEAELEARGQKPKVGRRYFPNNKLEDIIVNYPLRKRMTQDEIDEEIHDRVAFVDFLKGVLHFDPAKRWTPGQALHHPFLTGEQLLSPFRPPPEQIRTYVGQWMAMDHNAHTGHWVSGGLSPQVNGPGAVRYTNQGYHPSAIPYNSSYSSAGSFGSYGDPAGLGSSLGSYESSFMHHSFPNTVAMGMNGHHHGGPASGGFVGSPDTYHQRMLVSNVQTHIGMSPSNYRPVPLGASPSHHHQQTLVSNFFGSPGSSFHPSPISYGASPSSIYHMSPNSQLMLSPGSPSHLSPGRPGPTSPARAGASSLSKMAYQNNWSRNQHPNANGNDSFMRGGGLHGPNFTQKQRNGPAVTHFTQGSSTGFGDGTLGAFLNAPDNVSEASEDHPAPPDPKDWDPSYSDEQLLGDPGEASSSGITAMDVNEMSNGMSRLGTEAYSGPGQGGGPVLAGHRHGQSTSFSGQSRSNGSAHGSPSINGKGSGASPKGSPLGQQYLPHSSQYPPKHSNHASSSRLRPQPHSHYGVLQSSPEASSSTRAGHGQTMGESGNHVPNGHVTQAPRGRHGGPNHSTFGMCPPGGAGATVWHPTNAWVQVGSDPNISPWSQAGYSQPYQQNSPHESSSMNRRSARSLPPTAPGKAHGPKKSA